MNQTDMLNASSVNTTSGRGLSPKPYDHEGAMKFTVCVVLVYGVGVIGVLSMYTHRRRKHLVEQETSAFMKSYATCRDVLERKEQVSAAQSVIRTIGDETSRRASLASARPLVIRPQKLTLRTDPSTFHKLGNRSRAASLDVTSTLNVTSSLNVISSLNVTHDRDELTPFISRQSGSLKYKGQFLRTNSLGSERDRCIVETPETEDVADIADVPVFRYRVADVDQDSKESTAVNTPNDVRRLELSHSSVETLHDSNNDYLTASASSSPSQSVEIM